MAARVLAAFRTYSWGAVERDLAARFFANAPGCRHVVLADVTRGKIDADAYEVIEHTSDTAAFGLPDHPAGSSLWWNVDYGLYILRQRCPGYDHYLTSESDLAVNVSLRKLIDHVIRERIDLVAHRIRRSDPEWYWHGEAERLYADPWRSLLFFVIATGATLDLLFAARRRDARRLASGELKLWPFCEVFVPSELAMAGARMEGIGDFADTENLDFRPRIPIDVAQANRPGSLAHSVIASDRYFEEEFPKRRLREWVFETEPIHQAWKDRNIATYGAPALAAMREAGDHAAAELLRSRMKQAGLETDMDDDIAFCKPALTSSTSEWSRSRDPQIDASGANGVEVYVDHGFHTEAEENPWWLVDLGCDHVVSRIEITNRTAFNERFRTFKIDSSRDGANWSLRFVKLELSPVTFDIEAPFTVTFTDPFVARHVRITLLGHEAFHLRRVRIRGRRLGND